MLARFFIGLGEAAYGSVGLAVVLMVFSPTKRASLTGAFMAGGSFGSVLGVFLGGILAVQLGWRWSFGVMAILGLVLVALYALFVNDRRLARNQHPGNVPVRRRSTAPSQRAKLRTLVSTPAVICAYVGCGLQLFMAGALFAWLPSYLNRAYGLRPDKAGIAAAGFILLMGVGMIVCGIITDRLSQARRRSASGPPPWSSPRISLVAADRRLRPAARARCSSSSSRSAPSSPPAPPAPPAPWSPT